MPVPQENSLFVEQASCLFLTMVQDVSRSHFLQIQATDFCEEMIEGFTYSSSNALTGFL
ncbi:hypothetical protein [Microcoleus sp. K1-B6]|uniref:hypothetical protein n=1 Tax=Microcoleus sp. K1-B6 TaxID=2818787 RepID=UPI002FD7BDC8